MVLAVRTTIYEFGGDVIQNITHLQVLTKKDTRMLMCQFSDINVQLDLVSYSIQNMWVLLFPSVQTPK